MRTLNEDDENWRARTAKHGVYSEITKHVCREDLIKLMFSGSQWCPNSISGVLYCSPFIEHAHDPEHPNTYRISEAGKELIREQ
jgi:hypothetical protein